MFEVATAALYMRVVRVVSVRRRVLEEDPMPPCYYTALFCSLRLSIGTRLVRASCPHMQAYMRTVYARVYAGRRASRSNTGTAGLLVRMLDAHGDEAVAALVALARAMRDIRALGYRAALRFAADDLHRLYARVATLIGVGATDCILDLVERRDAQQCFIHDG